MSVDSAMNERVEALRKLVPAALRDFDEDAVHKARVTTRRLAAAMGLLESVVSKDLAKRFNRVLKKLRKRLGPLRDLDVILTRLDKLHAPAGAVAWLHGRLEDQRSTERKKAGEKSTAKILAKLGVWWALHGEIEEAAPAMDSLLAESIQRQLGEFHEQATQQPIADAHPLRIAGKQLRYTLELAADHGREPPKDVLKFFAKLQDALGEWHDLVVFSEVIVRASLDADLALHDPATAREILDLSKQMLGRAGRSLRRFSQLWNDGGESLADAIGRVFDLPSESKTDPDPSPTDETSHRAVESPDDPEAA